MARKNSKAKAPSKFQDLPPSRCRYCGGVIYYSPHGVIDESGKSHWMTCKISTRNARK